MQPCYPKQLFVLIILKEAYDKAKEEYKKRKQGIDSKKINKLSFSDVCDEWFATYKLNTSKEGTIISRDTQLKSLKKHFKNQTIGKSLIINIKSF